MRTDDFDSDNTTIVRMLHECLQSLEENSLDSSHVEQGTNKILVNAAITFLDRQNIARYDKSAGYGRGKIDIIQES